MSADLYIPHVFAYLLAFVHLLGLLAALHAIFTVRTSQGALAWALSLFFMPYLTLLPYIVFGLSRFDAYVKARRLADREMHLAMAEVNWRPWIEQAKVARQSAIFQQLRGLPHLVPLPCLANNKVRLLINGYSTFDAIFAAIEKAERVILVQFYIVRNDDLGRRLRDLLVRKASLGVQVYFLYDDIGSHSLSRAYIRSLREAGVQIQAFPTRGGLINRFQLNFRNHRKLVVIDGKLGFLGGHNVGDEYLGKKPPLAPWRDTHVSVEGPVVACLQETFAEDWFWACHQLPPLLPPQPANCQPAQSLCQVIASGPADEQETCSLMFVEAINAATSRVWITSPYFVPDEALSTALRLAVARRVDVRIMLPSRPDHHIVYAASSLYAFDALNEGVRIFRYQPGFLHQKVVLIDDHTTLIGTANLDNRSLRLNFEMMLLTIDTSFAHEVEQMLLEDFSHSEEQLKTDQEKIHQLQHLGMRVARLVSPIL